MNRNTDVDYPVGSRREVGGTREAESKMWGVARVATFLEDILKDQP